jgi:hypothetical protein
MPAKKKPSPTAVAAAKKKKLAAHTKSLKKLIKKK